MKMLSEESLRKKWEKRAIKSGSSYKSVLLQNLPDNLNQYLHDYHIRVIQEEFLPLLQDNPRILDLGCGYGRIEQALLDEKPDSKLVGVDFSLPYCKLYNEKRYGSVVCASLEALPFAKNSFDAIIAITVLMYAKPEQRNITLDNLISLLRPGGILLLIDPGQEILNFFARINPKSKKNSTGGSGFLLVELTALCINDKTEIISYGGIPVFSIFLPVLYILRSLKKFVSFILIPLRKLDIKLSKRWKYSLHRWIIFKKVQE